jgi:hypothetical protein
MDTTYTTTGNFGTEWYSWGMKKGWLLSLVLFVIIVIGLVLLFAIPAPKANAPTPIASSTPVATNAGIPDLITVDVPFPGQKVASPLTVTGKARGTWYFEASAPVSLLDANGNTLVQTHINAQGDWMTENFVPFTATLTFPAQPAGSKGTLVLKNDNPSGEPSRDKKVEVPVTF